jgi:protein-S-isoprenylcysteine O-methyltransferase Ste14
LRKEKDQLASKAETKTKTQAKAESNGKRALLTLWAGVLLAPMAFLSNLQVNYTLTQMLCPGGRTVLLHMATILFMLITAGGCLIAWRTWQRAGKEWPDESEDKRTRNRFLGIVGLMISALSFLIIVAQWIPQFIFNPCQR